MTRTPLLSAQRAGWLTRLVYWYARRRYGVLPEPLQAVAHHRGLMWSNALHELAYERAARRLDPVLRDLVVHRVATRVGCSWCVDFGTMIALKAGMTVQRHAELGRYATSTAFTPLEKLALQYADAMTDLPMTVTDELVATLREHLDAAQMVELTYSIALENLRSRSNHAMGLTAQGYTSGDACPLPWHEQITAAAPVPSSASRG